MRFRVGLSLLKVLLRVLIRNRDLSSKPTPTETVFCRSQSTVLHYAVVQPASVMSVFGSMRVWHSDGHA